jgi:integrase
MDKVKLTDIYISKKLKPEADDYYVGDTISPVVVLVRKSGSKSPLMFYRRPGDKKQVKLTLPWPLAAARRAAGDAKYEVSQGRDPFQAKRDAKDKAAAAARDTMLAVCEQYMAREGNKLRTAKARAAILKRCVYGPIGSRPIASVGRKDLSRLFDQIEDERGPHMADMVRAILNKIFHWHEGRSDEFRSPITKGLTPRVKPEQAVRDRTLSDDELVRVWRTADKSDGTFAALVRFLLLTGARLNEAARMRWDEIDGADWLLPAARHKAKTDVLRPLSKAALDVIKRLPRIGDSPFVFTTTGHKPFCNFSDAKREFDAACGVVGWRCHDLRRVARGLLSRAGVNSDVAEMILGHKLPHIRGVYDRYSYRAEKADALERLSSMIRSIATPPPANVHELKRKRG